MTAPEEGPRRPERVVLVLMDGSELEVSDDDLRLVGVCEDGVAVWATPDLGAPIRQARIGLFPARTWLALGYASWDDYCAEELRGRIALPREDRPAIVQSLRDAGLSTRAIASAVGISKNTVKSDLRNQVGQSDPPDDLAGVKNLTPHDANDLASAGKDLPPDTEPDTGLAPIIGRDGKQYTPPPPKPTVDPDAVASDLAERDPEYADQAARVHETPDAGDPSPSSTLGLTAAEYIEREEPGLLDSIAWRREYARASTRMTAFFAQWVPAEVARHMSAAEVEEDVAIVERMTTRWVREMRQAAGLTGGLRVVDGGRS